LTAYWQLRARTRELEELEKQVEGIVQETRELESTRERHSAELTAQQVYISRVLSSRGKLTFRTYLAGEFDQIETISRGSTSRYPRNRS
jgi:hypothetical protein